MEELEDDPQTFALARLPVDFQSFVDRRPIDVHFTCRGTVDAGDHVQQRGLATARFADDADKLACTNSKSISLSAW